VPNAPLRRPAQFDDDSGKVVDGSDVDHARLRQDRRSSKPVETVRLRVRRVWGFTAIRCQSRSRSDC
jgi:hypothetical protein